MKRYIKLIIGLVVLLFTASCLKDENILAPNDRNSQNIIEFYNLTAPTSLGTAPHVMYVPTTLEIQPSQEFEIAISYSGVEEGAPQDITVNLAVSPEVLDAYKAVVPNTASYIHAPTGTYEVPSSVVIKKGEKRVIVPITVKPDELDPTKSNAIALKITSASHGIVSGNFGTAIYSLPIKSIWEGTYTYTAVNYAGIDGNIPKGPQTDVKLYTVGPNRLKVDGLWQAYSGYAEYQFNADSDDITEILAFSGSLYPTTIVKMEFVDIENKIFEINWICLGRSVRERFVRTGD